MDKLSALLQDLNFNAEMFFSGKLCGLQAFEEDQNAGALHFLKQGSLTLQTDEHHELKLAPASVVFIPDGAKHRLKVKQPDDAELVCATVRFPAHQRRQLIEQLPKFICIGMDDEPGLSDTARRIFEEAFRADHGRQIMIDRLCDIFMVQVLRYVIDSGIVELGEISGNTHAALAPVLKLIRQTPEHEWALEEMASIAAMSRSKFSELFRKTVGLPPMEYLTELRMNTAKTLLKKNKAASIVANEVGYESASSLSRVFKKRFGMTPKQWQKNQLSERPSARSE